MTQNDITKTGLSEFDAYLENIAAKPATFAVRMFNGRPSLVFRRTIHHDEVKRIKDDALKAIQAVIENNYPSAWKPWIPNDLTVIGRAKHFAERHVGVLKWFDCDEPTEEQKGLESFRQVGEQWQEERIVEEKWDELHFLMMAKRDGHGFQSLIDGMNEQLGVGYTSSDVTRFQREARPVQE